MLSRPAVRAPVRVVVVAAIHTLPQVEHGKRARGESVGAVARPMNRGEELARVGRARGAEGSGVDVGRGDGVGALPVFKGVVGCAVTKRVAGL